MTDQTQDPQTQDDKNLNQDINQNTGVFGGSDDIFENSDILEPITEITKDSSTEATQEVMPEIVETMPEIKIEEPKINEEKTTEIEHEWEKMDDFFDPFDDELEEVEEDDAPNFEDSPEIDALDDLDNIDVDVETLEEIKPVIETKKEIVTPVVTESAQPETKTKPEIKDINETIARIEKRAQEAREKAAKLEDTKTVPVVTEKKEEVKPEIKKEVKTEKTKIETKPIETEKVEEIKIAPVVKKEIKTEEKKIETKKPEIKIEKAKTNPTKSDLQNKFNELLGETKKVYELLGEKDTFEGFDVVGGNDDRLKTTYNFILSGDDKEHLEIKKIELNKTDNNVQEFKLDFVLNETSLNIKIDWELLYDEISDLQENANKKMQVMEKLNKFIFLISEEFKKLEKEKWKKEKRNIMKGIFRNFMF